MLERTNNSTTHPDLAKTLAVQILHNIRILNHMLNSFILVKEFGKFLKKTDENDKRYMEQVERPS